MSAPPAMPPQPPPLPAEGGAEAPHRSVLRLPAGKKPQGTRMVPPRKPLPPDTQLGDYTILRTLGEGGFGITYLAYLTATGDKVVMKEHMPCGLAVRAEDGLTVRAVSDEAAARLEAGKLEFLREMTVLTGLRHPGIVPMLGSVQANGTIYYIMEYVRGISPRPPRQITLDDTERRREARAIRRHLLSMLDTLEYLGQNDVVHRDIKPENIIISEKGEPVLLDFGSARQTGGGKTFPNIYTPAFAAPEQVTAATDEELAESIGPWTDIYSLGVVCYYFVMRMLPPRAEQRLRAETDPYLPLTGHADLVDHYTPAFLNAIDKALELNPLDRWQSAQEWKLAVCLGQMPLSRRYKERVRRWGIAGGIALLALGAVTAWAVKERRDAVELYQNSLVFADGLQREYNRLSIDMPNSTQLQQSLGERIQDYLQTMQQAGADDEKLESAIGLAWRSLGLIYLERLENTGAQDAYAHAEYIFRKLLREHPQEHRYVPDLARSVRGLLQVAQRRGDVARVKELNDELRGLVDGFSDSDELRDILLRGEVMLNDAWLAQMDGRLDDAARRARAAVDFHRAQAKLHPQEMAAQQGLGNALCALGELELCHGRDSDAWQEAYDIFKEQARLNPYRLSPLEGIVRVYRGWAEVAERRAEAVFNTPEAHGHEKTALAHYANLISLCAEMEKLNSHHIGYVCTECNALLERAHLCVFQGNPQEAVSLCRSIIARLDPLLAERADDVSLQEVLASAWWGLGRAYMQDAATHPQAREALQRSCELYAALTARMPQHREARCCHAAALAESAALARLMNNPQQAAEHTAAAEKVLAALERDNPCPALSRRMQMVRQSLHPEKG
ncbi:MAG: serine/threonine protein kinase [Akkermansia sp.]|nr:serine/threonine protein kinase [Akkermansia sp.]